MTFPRRGGAIPYEDRADVEDLIARYANSWEFRACEAWADLFAEDGAFFHVRGRAALEALCREATEHQVHAQTNTMLVQVSEDRILGVTNVVFGTHEPGVGGSARLTGYGDYHDVFVRTPAGWRFGSRRAVPHLAEPLPEELG